MSKQIVYIPIKEVTLLEDRAQIKRWGAIELTAGQTCVVINDVAPVLSDKSLIIKPGADVSLQVIDSRVRRERKIREQDKPQDEKAIERDLEKLKEQKAARACDMSELEDKATSLEHIIKLTLKDIPEDVSWGGKLQAEQAKQIAAYEDEMLAIDLVWQKKEQEHNTLDEKFNDAQQLLNTLRTPASYNRGVIEAELMVEQAGRYEIQIEYLVPNACWRPKHKAELLDDTLKFEMDGCVWQNTGEDWNNVQLYFSTQRISLGEKPPELNDDLIRIQKKAKEETVEVREEKIQDVGQGVTKITTSQTLPGIDDSGTVQNLRADRPASVPSNGCPYRVHIAGFESASEAVLQMMPELAQVAFVRSDQVNAMPQPILAGPVDLVKNNGYVGRTSILYTAPNESFKLGWGPDPEIRVVRMESHQEEEAKMLGSWHSKYYTIRLRINNLGENVKTFTVQERIPVSEIEKVRVELNEKETTQVTSKPDQDGMLKWERTLDPYQHNEIVLKYCIKTHKAVVGARS